MDITKCFAPLIEARRFDKIAILLGFIIQNICPFRTKEAYNDILIGSAPQGVGWKGFFGWRVFDILPEKEISVDELKDRIKNPEIQAELREVFNLSQKVLIIPMMKFMFEEESGRDGRNMYQQEMNRWLNLDQLETTERGNNGWMTIELYSRLCNQDIMEKFKPAHHVYYKKKKKEMDYTAPEFIMPTKLGYSRGHQTTLSILEKLVKELNKRAGEGGWTITNEHRNPDKHGFPGYMSYDMALWKDDILYGFIEYDGKQHREYTPYFHRGGLKQFLSLHLKDKIKNNDALILCNEKRCLRVNRLDKIYIKQKIIGWMGNDM